MALFSQVGSICKQSISQNSASCMLNSVRCMSSRIFVAGLPYSIDDSTLKEAFSQFGKVSSVRVVVDQETARSKGFGFVDFADAESAQSALAMDGQELSGRSLHVNIANETRPASRVGFGGGRGGRDGGRGRY